MKREKWGENEYDNEGYWRQVAAEDKARKARQAVTPTPVTEAEIREEMSTVDAAEHACERGEISGSN